MPAGFSSSRSMRLTGRLGYPEQVGHVRLLNAAEPANKPER